MKTRKRELKRVDSNQCLCGLENPIFSVNNSKVADFDFPEISQQCVKVELNFCRMVEYNVLLTSVLNKKKVVLWFLYMMS